MNEDANKIIRAYLVTKETLTDIVGARIYCPRLPENAELPALGFFTRGGGSTPYIPGIITPSVQFDCWDDNTQGAREVYRALYDVLQGVQNETVTHDGSDYLLMSAIEEVQGQDLQDVDIPKYYKVLTSFSIMIRAI